MFSEPQVKALSSKLVASQPCSSTPSIEERRQLRRLMREAKKALEEMGPLNQLVWLFGALVQLSLHDNV